MRLPGYLLFVRDRTLVAQPFDAKALKTTGRARSAGRADRNRHASAWRASRSRATATLAYRTGESGTRLLWVDRYGKELETAGEAGDSREPALSPRGDRIAFDLNDASSGKGDIWVRDLGARRQLAPHLRARRRVRAGLVSRREAASSTARPQRSGATSSRRRRRNRRGKGALQVGRIQARHRLVPGRPVHRGPGSDQGRPAGTSGLLPTFGDRKPISRPADARSTR